jgi:hypothetical protein
MFCSIFSLATLAVLHVFFLASVDANSELMDRLVKKYQVNTKTRLSHYGECPASKLAIRKEW